MSSIYPTLDLKGQTVLITGKQKHMLKYTARSGVCHPLSFDPYISHATDVTAA